MRTLFRELWKYFRDWLRAGSPRPDHAESVAGVFAALALTLAVSVLALGTQQLPVLLVVTTATIATTVIALWRGGCRVTIVSAVLFGLGVWSALQAVPLPLGILRVLSPRAAEIWSRAYDLTDAGRRTASISLDPGASLVEALKWTTYGAAAVVGDLLARRIGLLRIAALALGLSALVALITLAHGLLHARALYGFYVPTFDPGPWGFGPLLNGNNRSGYLNLGAFSGFAILVSRRNKGARWPVALAVGVVVAVSALARSRGGLGALVVGSVAVVLLLLRRALTHHRSQRPFYVRAAMAPILALAGGVALALIGGDGQMWTKMRQESLAKLHVASWTRPMLADFPIFGVGRGAFETVFPAYRMNGDHIVYRHAENFVTDWATGWGIPFALTALAALAWAIRPRRGEESVKTVLRLAIAVLLIQNLVDHALETPAIAMLVAVIAAALACEGPSTSFGESRRSPIALACGTFAIAVCSIIWSRHLIASDQAVLSARVRDLKHDEPETYPAVLSDIRDAIRRHPADPFLPVLAAATARHLPNARPLRWLGWALERDMNSGHGHLALAYFLQLGGVTQQALHELRTAAENDMSLRTRVARWATVFARDPREARTVVLDGADGAPMLLVFAGSWQFRPYRFALLEEATERDPSLFEGHLMAASGYIGAIEHSDDPSCHWANLPRCIEAATRHTRALEQIAPEKSSATELAARLLAATGRIEQALSLLSNRCAFFAKSSTCWARRIELGHAEIAGPEYTRALRAYYAAACTNPPTCVNASVYLAGALRRRSDNLGALEYYGKAVEAGANSADIWMAIAAVARKAGQPNRATEALKKAQKSAKGDAEKEAKVENALRGVLPANLKDQP